MSYSPPLSHSFLDIDVSATDLPKLLNAIEEASHSNGPSIVGNHNLHSLYLYHYHPDIRPFFGLSSFNFADGTPIVWLGKLFGAPLKSPHRVTYVDLLMPLLEMGNKLGWKVFFLGGKPDNASRIQEFVNEKFPQLNFQSHHGYFNRKSDSEENQKVLETINDFAPTLLLVGMGMPIQESWIAQYHEQLNTRVIMNGGACFDYFIGEQKKPPRWLGPMGLEWLYRLFSNPKRLYKRYLIEPIFLVPIIARHFFRSKVGKAALLVLCTLLSGIFSAQAQEKDSTALQQISIESINTLSTGGMQPHYHLFNREGVLPDEGAASALLTNYERTDSFHKHIGLHTEASLLLRTATPWARLQRFSASLKVGDLFLQAGRFNYSPGPAFDALSSGSLFLSQNAVPLPQVVLGSRDLSIAPLREYAGLIGHFSLGYLGHSSVTFDRLFHHKSAGIRIGPRNTTCFTASLNHSVIFGGALRSGIDIPTELWNVITAKGSEENTVLSGETANRIGSHIGVYHFSLKQRVKHWYVQLYYQYMFEDNSGRRGFRENLDGLYGIKFRNRKRRPFIKQITYELIHTTYQSGEGLPDTSVAGAVQNGVRLGGRDDYYNNYLYRDGYTYKGLVLGNPLLLTYNRTLQFWDSYNNYGVQIVNNRLLAHHMAMTGFLGEKWRYDLMLTLCKNYGTYTANHGGRFEWSDLNPNFDPRNNPFHHIPKQVHSFLRLTHDLATTMKKHKLMASLSVAFDHGDMYTSAGLLGSIKYTM